MLLYDCYKLPKRKKLPKKKPRIKKETSHKERIIT